MSKLNVKDVIVSLAALMVIAASGIFMFDKLSQNKESSQSEKVVSDAAGDVGATTSTSPATAAPKLGKINEKASESKAVIDEPLEQSVKTEVVVDTKSNDVKADESKYAPGKMRSAASVAEKKHLTKYMD